MFYSKRTGRRAYSRMRRASVRLCAHGRSYVHCTAYAAVYGSFLVKYLMGLGHNFKAFTAMYT